MLVTDTVYRRMEEGTASYDVTAETTTDCGATCVGVDFTDVQNALVDAISNAFPGATTTGSKSVTELASTG